MINIYRKKFLFIFTGIVILIFLLNSRLILKGASIGLSLWFQTIIPTLLPFTILSSILLDLHAENFIAKYLSPFTAPVFGLSPAGNYILFIGLFCGYPLGAKTSAELVRSGRISVSEGQYLMNFCNNLSPAFIISFICGSLLHNAKIIPTVLLLLYGVPIILGIITKPIYLKQSQKALTCMSVKIAERKENTVKTATMTDMLDHAITTASETMLKLGGYIMLFSIFATLIEHCYILPSEIRLFLSAISEVSNGCKIICENLSFTFKKLMLPALLSSITFGGIAGIAQTAGMLYNTELSLKQYIYFRLIAAFVVFIISYIFF